MFEDLNVRGNVWNSVKKWINEKHPKLFEDYEHVYFSKSDYWIKVEEEIKQFCKKQKIEYRIYFYHRKK